jgi:hypothetical protein
VSALTLFYHFFLTGILNTVFNIPFSTKGMENGIYQADRRAKNAQSKVSCAQRRGERSRANPQKRGQHFAAGAERTATAQGAGYGVIIE